MPVAILGIQIILWCFDVQNNSKFKVVIGDGNDIDDLKEAIKEKCEYGFASHLLKLWRVNTDQTIFEESLNNELKDTAKTIGETFCGVQGGNIRVVVRAPDTEQLSATGGEQELKRHIDEIADKINSKVDGLNDEMRGLNREVKRVCFAADAWYSAIGTFTKTEKGKFVQERGVKIQFHLDLTKKEKVQDYFIDECKAFENYVNIQNKLIVRDTHFSPLLDTRKPDFVFIPSNSSLDPLSVVAIGKIKKQVEPSLKFGEETVKLVRSIGVGRTSVVYEGIYKDISVAVKMMKKANYLSCIERERAVLEELSKLDSPHIPKILFYDKNTLVMTPLGKRINNLQKTDIKDIINTLKHVHSYEYVYRDLRKYNYLRNLDDSKKTILIIDWGYSTRNREDTAFVGALECMPDE
ncbi:36678_t:CDS:2, partial [Racocetra persica]